VSRATKQLREEHGGIEVMLEILGRVGARLKAGGHVDPAHLEGIMEFLAVFVDRCHHAKEEDHLFPALEQAGLSAEGAPVGVLLGEHRDGRELIRGMRAALEGVERGDGPATARFVEKAQRYRDLLLSHIDKENGILYPMVEARLGEEQDRRLVEAFDRVEEERVGRGRHEEFHRLMERLEGLYRS